MFLHQLTTEFLPQIPDLHQLLQAGARVADVGCGEGWSAIGLALEYPACEIDGYDAVPALKCLHDLQDPVAVLSAMRRIAEPGTPVVVMDERVADTFSPDAGPVEELLDRVLSARRNVPRG